MTLLIRINKIQNEQWANLNPSFPPSVLVHRTGLIRRSIALNEQVSQTEHNPDCVDPL